MNKDIQNLEPKALWKNFHALTQIPRPSKHEQKACEFAINFGKNLGLETIQDETGNVIIRKPATAGMENRKTVVLQSHLDMVPQKNSDKQHDFLKDPIEAYIDGEWVTANGTTLGADNGIGCAAIFAILEDKTIQHGPIEALLTIDEETGMTGAFGLKAGVLKGDILMNLDSEDEGELYVGCAGGVDANISMKYNTEATPADSTAFELNITGLKGGHSGMDIILGRGNANKVFFRILKNAETKFGVRLAAIDGGSLRNAIPRESFATITVATKNADQLKAFVTEMTKIVAAELSATEPDLKIELKPCATPAQVWTLKDQKTLTNVVYALPNGVIRMSDSMPGLVETSTNLAFVKANDGEVKIACLLRSSVDTAKESLSEMMQAVCELAGINIVMTGAYPGWKPNMSSPILNEMKTVYNKLYGKTPEVKAIHAGLECGLLGGVYPNWDMISFGPTIRYPHSPDEKVNIESVGKFWNYLVETLKNVPAK